MRSNPRGIGFERVKRAFDVVAASLGLVLCFPLILAASAWIRFVDGGPAFYRQWRVGRNGWLFRLFKLRTMSANAEPDGVARFAQDRDPRILPGCAWMRKSHLDELPQLWNVLRGQMSLVGPRPERPEIINALGRTLPGIERRLAGKPGLTGLAQVANGYTNDAAGMRRKLANDLVYLRNRTLWNEVRLVIATIPKVWDRTAI